MRMTKLTACPVCRSAAARPPALGWDERRQRCGICEHDRLQRAADGEHGRART